MVALPIGAMAALIPHLRGHDTLTISSDEIVCRCGEKEWRTKLSDIARLHKFGEQWVFETAPPHRRFYLRLRGHEHHLALIAQLLDERVRSLKLEWVDSVAKILQLLR